MRTFSGDVPHALDDALAFAALARSAGSSFLIPIMVWSLRSSSCCRRFKSFGFARSAAGVTPSPTHIAAAVPTACPTAAHVDITRVEQNATCEQLMLRPAMKRLSKSLA